MKSERKKYLVDFKINNSRFNRALPLEGVMQ